MGAQALRVLLVEDDDAVRSITRVMLERIGYDVLSAESPEVAVDHLTGPQKIDLVLTDLVLPGGSGVQLATEVQRLRPGLRVLFISGWLDHPAVVGLRNRFLPKPYGMLELQSAVRDLMLTEPASGVLPRAGPTRH